MKKQGFTLMELLLVGNIVAYLLFWIGSALAAQSRSLLAEERQLIAKQDVTDFLRYVEQTVRRRSAPNFLPPGLATPLATLFPTINLTNDFPNSFFAPPSLAFLTPAGIPCTDFAVLQTNGTTLVPRLVLFSSRCQNPANAGIQRFGSPHPDLSCAPNTFPTVIQTRYDNVFNNAPSTAAPFPVRQEVLGMSACFRVQFGPAASAPPAQFPLSVDVEVGALYQAGDNSLGWVQENLLLDLQMISRNAEYLSP